MVTETELLEYTVLTPLDICLWSRMKREVCKRKMGYTSRIASLLFGCRCPRKGK